MYSSILFILTICIVSGHEIYTRTQLRGLYHHRMNKLLNEDIQFIVERVVAFAQENYTSYTHTYMADSSKNYVGSTYNLIKFSDKKILSRLQTILIDANITISEPKCCDPRCDNPNIISPLCKFIVINW